MEQKSCMSAKASCSDSTATMDMSAGSDSGSCNSHHCNKDCCQNIAKYYKLDESKQAKNASAELLKKPALVYALLVVYNYSFLINEGLKSQFLHYKPPIVQEDILVLFQTFLC